MSTFFWMTPTWPAIVVKVTPSSACTANTTSELQGMYSTRDSWGEPTVVGVKVVLAGIGGLSVRPPATVLYQETPVTTPSNLPLSETAARDTVPSVTVVMTS